MKRLRFTKEQRPGAVSTTRSARVGRAHRQASLVANNIFVHSRLPGAISESVDAFRSEVARVNFLTEPGY
ncbi:MAG: hypothetical protein WD038_02285 [Balneolales bacterium]